MRVPPLKIKIMLESNALKSTMLVGRLGVQGRVSLVPSRCLGPLQRGAKETPRRLFTIMLYDMICYTIVMLYYTIVYYINYIILY